MSNYTLKQSLNENTILFQLGQKYNVDMYELGYLRHYEERFDSIRNDVKKVLEIGVETGCSYSMWLEYFPNATIYGFDICNEEDRSGYVDLVRFTTMYGKDFDLIIDDGGHTMRQQQITLSGLFDAVKSGGYYVIEDLHTCSGQWKSLYGFDVIEEGDTLTKDIIKSLESGDNSITKTSYIDEEQMKKIRDSITSCNLEIGNENYKDYIWPTMLSFMTKK